MVVIISVGMTVKKVSIPVTMYLQIYNSMLVALEIMWCIQHVRALQGQSLEAKTRGVWLVPCTYSSD